MAWDQTTKVQEQVEDWETVPLLEKRKNVRLKRNLGRKENT